MLHKSIYVLNEGFLIFCYCLFFNVSEILAKNVSLFYDGVGGNYIVTSPSYPQPYPTNGNTYSYIVQNPNPRGFVQVTFHNVDIDQEKSLRIFDGGNDTTTRDCFVYSDHFSFYQSGTRSVMILFKPGKSNGYNLHRGFNLTFKFIHSRRFHLTRFHTERRCCSMLHCSGTSCTCPTSSNVCYDKELDVCDNYTDCPLGSDEKGCSHRDESLSIWEYVKFFAIFIAAVCVISTCKKSQSNQCPRENRASSQKNCLCRSMSAIWRKLATWMAEAKTCTVLYGRLCLHRARGTHPAQTAESQPANRDSRRRRGSSWRTNLPAHANRGSYIYIIGANNANRNLNVSVIEPPPYSESVSPVGETFLAPPPSYDEVVQQNRENGASDNNRSNNTLPDLVANRNNDGRVEERSDVVEDPPSYDEVLESSSSISNRNQRY